MITSSIIPPAGDSANDAARFSTVVEGSTSVCKLVEKNGELLFSKSLKSQYQNDEAYRRLFRKEFEVGQKVDSPYVIKYKQLVESDNRLRLLMDYIEGWTLEEWLKKDSAWFADQSNMMQFMDQMLDGLYCMHQQQVVHLDLSMTNIMLTNINKDVRIIDLGFCYSPAHPSPIGATHQYGAPELENPKVRIDARADLYSFGKIVLEILKVVKENSSQTWLHKIEKVAIRCCSETPEERYSSAQAVKEALHAEVNSRKSVWIWAVAAVVVVVLAVVLAYMMIHDTKDKAPEIAAADEGANKAVVDSVVDKEIVDKPEVRVDTPMVSVTKEPVEKDSTWAPKHDFPFKAIVSSGNQFYARIGSMDKLERVPVTVGMRFSDDILSVQIFGRVLPQKEYKIYADIDDRESNGFTHEIIQQGVKWYILKPAGFHAKKCKARNTKLDLFTVFMDLSHLEGGTYTLQLYDGIMTPVDETMPHMITDEIKIPFTVN